MTTDRSGERRWMVLGQDGRHVWLGRHSDPSERELADVEGTLVASGTAAWLAVTRGDYWDAAARLEVMIVRPLGSIQGDRGAAIEAFERARSVTLAG